MEKNFIPSGFYCIYVPCHPVDCEVCCSVAIISSVCALSIVSRLKRKRRKMRQRSKWTELTYSLHSVVHSYQQDIHLCLLCTKTNWCFCVLSLGGGSMCLRKLIKFHDVICSGRVCMVGINWKARLWRGGPGRENQLATTTDGPCGLAFTFCASWAAASSPFHKIRHSFSGDVVFLAVRPEGRRGKVSGRAREGGWLALPGCVMAPGTQLDIHS